jgi:hypothetical protein
MLKFGDVIITVACLAVVTFLLDTVLALVIVPLNTSWGLDVTLIVSVLISGLIVGYAFAGKIREESRMLSIGEVLVLFAVLVALSVMTQYSAVEHFGPLIDQHLNSTYSKTTTSSWTNTDWFAYEMTMLRIYTVLPMIYVLVFGFIGLYLGSMRKPSAKTKE